MQLYSSEILLFHTGKGFFRNLFVHLGFCGTLSFVLLDKVAATDAFVFLFAITSNNRIQRGKWSGFQVTSL